MQDLADIAAGRAVYVGMHSNRETLVRMPDGRVICVRLPPGITPDRLAALAADRIRANDAPDGPNQAPNLA